MMSTFFSENILPLFRKLVNIVNDKMIIFIMFLGQIIKKFILRGILVLLMEFAAMLLNIFNLK